MMPTVESLLEDNVTLKVECIDRLSLFITKSYVRVVRPIFQRLDPQLPEDSPGPLRRAWMACEKELDKVVKEARLAA